MRYTRYIAAALKELDEWCANSSEAPKHSPGFYRSVRQHLEWLRVVDDTSQLARGARDLTRRIIDSGPVGSDFLPSFDELASALYRFEQRRQRQG